MTGVRKPGFNAGDQHGPVGGLNPPSPLAACRLLASPFVSVAPQIPLSPTRLSNGEKNAIPMSLPSVPGMPARGATAVAVDGVPIFPSYSSQGRHAWVGCDLDHCNGHAKEVCALLKMLRWPASASE